MFHRNINRKKDEKNGTPYSYLEFTLIFQALLRRVVLFLGRISLLAGLYLIRGGPLQWAARRDQPRYDANSQPSRHTYPSVYASCFGKACQRQGRFHTIL